MRISINLATHPFVELRPLFAKLRIAMAALALLAVGLGIGLHVMSARAKVEEAQMDALKQQTQALDNERMANEARMRQTQNRAVLERSKFLNALFASKSFSWTAVMMDLERVLPAGVQVTSIEPALTPDGDVNIRMRVSGDRERTVELVRNLERSQRFLSPHLANETAQNQEAGKVVQAAMVPGGVEFDILSGYNPLPPEMKTGDREQGTGNGKPLGKAGAVKTPAGPAAKKATPGPAAAAPKAKKPVAPGVKP
jgi:type IV pilus assembly protein PilN